DKPFLKFERLLDTYMTNAPRWLRSFRLAMPVWIREKLFQRRQLATALTRKDQVVTCCLSGVGIDKIL
ncbi:MAG: hypothetical protein QF637_00500, partial [Acidimicrobiales bacterium]|nr:hypothetical protein [Acidimicrobiales bacterium]